ncbi:MAG: hypothetical protein ABI609_08365 [Acidobacteriota bacterium]
MPVTVLVRPDGDQTCLLWRVSTRNDFSITLVGSYPPPGGCSPEGQPVALGGLAAGCYHLEARRPDGAVSSEVYFTVLSSPGPLPTEEIEIRPARPTTVDPIDVVLSVQDSAPCFAIWGVHDVAIVGDTVTIALNTSTGPSLCPPSVPRQHGFLLHLPSLAAGITTVVVPGFGLQRHLSPALAPIAWAGEPPGEGGPDLTRYEPCLVRGEAQLSTRRLAASDATIVDLVVSAGLAATDHESDSETSIAVDPQDPDRISISAFSGGWGTRTPLWNSPRAPTAA